MNRKRPIIPAERLDTLRQKILTALQGGPLTAREISEQIGIAEQDVYDHLEHIRHSLHSREACLVVLPAACKKCGFVFSKRQRLTKPGRCPRCRGESIHRPRYYCQS
jgi:predicted Zn-ribbon and HTH transcriptional regulator